MGKKELGSVGVIESLIREGRIPTFSEPIILQQNKVRIPCIIPGIEGSEAEIRLITPQNKTQIQRRIKRALGR